MIDFIFIKKKMFAKYSLSRPIQERFSTLSRLLKKHLNESGLFELVLRPHYVSLRDYCLLKKAFRRFSFFSVTRVPRPLNRSPLRNPFPEEHASPPIKNSLNNTPPLSRIALFIARFKRTLVARSRCRC